MTEFFYGKEIHEVEIRKKKKRTRGNCGNKK